MTYSEALKRAQGLAEAVRARGVKVSIELQPGADGRWVYPAEKIAVMSHHTATRRAWGLTPALYICKKGRSDVPGPLCNNYGGWDLVFRIITMGIANHSGKGGPMKMLKGGTVPKDRGRYLIDGTEFEGGLNAADFSDEYREFMARCSAGRLDFYGLPVESHVEHSTWAPGRKIDRLGYTTDSGRREIILLGGLTRPIVPVTPTFTYEDPSKDYSNGSRVLTIGKAGSDVGWVQAHLLANVLVDRKYGPWTASAVKVWQRSQGLVRDGIFGPISWAVAVNLGNKQQVRDLQKAVHVAQDAYWGPTTDRSLNMVRAVARTGGFPWGVVAVQKAVGAVPDGSWGPVSKAALGVTIRAVQRALKCVDDGSWGPVTDKAYTMTRNRNYLRR